MCKKNFSDSYSYHNENLFQDVRKNIFFFQSLPRLFLEFVLIISFSLLAFLILIQGKTVNEFITILGLFTAVSFRLLPSLGRILTNLQSLKSFFSSGLVI